MKRIIKAGATDQTIDIFILDSSSTTGAGKTGLAYNTASLVCYYRKGATGSATALSLATQTVGGAHSDGGFVEIDATNMPGMYRLDLSDTIVAATGAVTMMLKGATGMAPVTVELQVAAIDVNDSVRLGLTALPNAAADAAGGLPISDAGGLNLDAIKTATDQIGTAGVGLTNIGDARIGDIDLYVKEINHRVVVMESFDLNGWDGAQAVSVSFSGSIGAGSFIRLYGIDMGVDGYINQFALGSINSTGAFTKDAGWTGAITRECLQVQLATTATTFIDTGVLSITVYTNHGQLSYSINIPDMIAWDEYDFIARADGELMNMAYERRIRQNIPITPAQVNAEVLDVLNVDTFAEPGQEAPAATNTLAKKIGYLFKFLRNKVTQDATTLSVFADDGTTVDQKSTVSDDATTYTRGEIGSGP